MNFNVHFITGASTLVMPILQIKKQTHRSDDITRTWFKAGHVGKLSASLSFTGMEVEGEIELCM